MDWQEGWNCEYFILYLDFIIKAVSVLSISVEQYKKIRSRFSPLGIKGWVKQIKHNEFILDLNNCYYPHCARALKEKKNPEQLRWIYMLSETWP